MQKSSATRSAKSKDWNTGGSCTVSGASSANEITKSVTGYYSVEQKTLTWLNKYLKEGKDNRALGTSFKLVKPEDNKDFLIIPVYQGHSGMTWDLHLVAENNSSVLKDYKIWSHSENIKYTQDFNVDGGVEFFYNTTDDSSNGSDISEWAEGGVVKEIMLKRAFCNDDENNPSVADNATLSLELPAGGYVDAYLTNKDENKRGEYQYRWRIFADNRENSSSKRFDFKLTNIIEQSWFPTDNLWNLVLRVDYYNGNCSFDTFKDNRVRIFVKYDKSSEVNLTSMDCGSSTQNFINRHTIDRKNVQSQPIRIDCSKIKDDFYFYLDVTRGDEYVTGDDDQAVTGAHQSSDDGMMLALLDNSTTEKLVTSSSDLATSLSSIIDMTGVSSCEYFVIGCEDANLKDSDWDINDVVFLVVGLDKAPKIKELIKKRYMIEDLGGTFDFDFNDIVVDVTQERLKNVSDGTYSNTFGNGGYKQYATLKHLCGTIPFKIQIGNTVIGGSDHDGKYAGNNGGCSEGEYGYDPTNDNYYAPLMNAEVTGWKPNENNITVTTWPTQAGWTDPGTGGYVGNYPDGVSFSFPENKQYPYIIACDQTVGWMPELTSVPHTWFKTWKDDNYLNWTPTVPDNNQPVTPPTPSPVSIFTYSGDKADYNGETFIKINLGNQLQNKGISKVTVKSKTAISSAAFGCSSTEWKETSFTVEANSSSEVTLSADILSQINGGGDLVIQIYGINLEVFDFSNFDVTYASAN